MKNTLFWKSASSWRKMINFQLQHLEKNSVHMKLQENFLKVMENKQSSVNMELATTFLETVRKKCVNTRSYKWNNNFVWTSKYCGHGKKR